MNEFKTLPNMRISQVSLDTTNPRIGKQADEKACIEAIVNKNREHMLNLIEDIAAEGLTPIPIILSKNKNGEWIVRDGNRRVTALKLLKSPNLAPSEEMTKKIKAIKDKYPNYSLEIKTAHEFESEEAVQKYLDKIHKGSQDGVGQIEWSTIEKARHNQKVGNKDKNIRALNFLIWAEKECRISIDEENFPFTTLSDRLMAVNRLERIGLIIDDEGASCLPTRDLAITIKKVTRIISDLENKKIDSRSLLGAKEQDEYINKLCTEYGEGIIEPKSATNETSQTNATTNEIPQTNTSTTNTQNPMTNPTIPPSKPLSERTYIYHKARPAFSVPVDKVKARSIIVELKTLNVKDKPIAGSMLLRSLIELSVEYYIENKNVSMRDNSSTKNKIKKVAEDMQSKQVISQDTLELIKKHLYNDESLFGLDTLHKIVHTDIYHPTYRVINSLWDETREFLSLCWVD